MNFTVMLVKEKGFKSHVMVRKVGIELLCQNEILLRHEFLNCYVWLI